MQVLTVTNKDFDHYEVHFKLCFLKFCVDQDYNAFRVDAQKVGVRLEVRDLTFEQLDAALIKILTDSQ